MFWKNSLVLGLLSCVLLTNAALQRADQNVVQLDEENWDRMLTGEWMVKFYAPWCPACKDLNPVWSRLGDMKKDLGINVGKVDVTVSPGLSGRFMVTALPTIYHVKDGLFRQYKSPRNHDSLVNFVKAKTWMKVEPIPGWKSPTSIQMSIISQFFKMSQVLRAVHTKLMEDYGLPTWGSYFIFAIATIIIGAVVGLIMVCIIDFIYPPKPIEPQIIRRQPRDQGDKDKTSDDESFINNVKDDLVDEDASDSEDKPDDSNERKQDSAANSPNARKRKSRKAD